ncbi:hypothetical protein LCGC14_1527370 [marine sediment metagenome]|uniref:dATP/dGTP diphosphohydrolase N-terminal domain-containing protein n=1 Tax=marine sediment metagenome TaxID=412755 RepID=A0A0F9IX86_9ZZZZ
MTTTLNRSVLEYEGKCTKDPKPVIPHEVICEYEGKREFDLCKIHDWYYLKDGKCEHCEGVIPHEIHDGSDQLQGMKFDEDKLRWDLLPYDAVEKIVEIITHGAKKYAPENWKKVNIDRFFAAAMRHFTAWKKGEEFDKDSGFTHLAHVGCNILFMMWIEENKVRIYPQKDIDHVALSG